VVKIRLRRIGTKGRPFYRVVVAQSTAGRNGKFVETLGTYDPIVKPTRIEVNQERALHWLRIGAQPTETTAYLLNKVGILEQYFQERPNARKSFSFLDKRTAATSVASVVDHQATDAKSAQKTTPAEPAPAEELNEAVVATAASEDLPSSDVVPDAAPVEAAPDAATEDSAPETTE
jgi:small subunit ribosomal protein S16